MRKLLVNPSKAVWGCACFLLILYVVVLGAQTWSRIRFPWDLYIWPESPFLTNMLKLEHQPSIYDAPADANSFVYSPGTEYLCRALLSPFGRELDIRFCRLVMILVALLTSAIAALVMLQLVKPGVPIRRKKLFVAMSVCVVLLALGANFTFDIVDPDSLHALLAVLLLWLCFRAWETKKFGFALAAMIAGGLAVFAKQTAAFSIVGVAMCLVVSRQWNKRQCLLLLGAGIATSAISLWLLWLPEHARFFTFDLLSRHAVHPAKIWQGVAYLAGANGGALLILCALAMFVFWRTGGACRRYLVCWLAVGIFTVGPGMAAYIKEEGAANNLQLSVTWMVFLVCPFLAILLNSERGNETMPVFEEAPLLQRKNVRFGLSLLALFGVIWFVPRKTTPTKADYDYCETVEKSIRDDLQHGRTVLVAHGTEMLIRSGSRQVPLDRANTLMELNVGNLGDLAKTSDRIRAHYYQRLYLTVRSWYGKEVLDAIDSNYEVETIIKTSAPSTRGYNEGFEDGLMADCLVLKPKDKSALTKR